MIGLDVTRQIVLTPDLLEYMKRLDPETGRFVQSITKFYFVLLAVGVSDRVCDQ